VPSFEGQGHRRHGQTERRADGRDRGAHQLARTGVSHANGAATRTVSQPKVN